MAIESMSAGHNLITAEILSEILERGNILTTIAALKAAGRLNIFGLSPKIEGLAKSRNNDIRRAALDFLKTAVTD